MAQISLVKVGMSGGEIILILETTHTDYPGEVLQFDKHFLDSTPAATIKNNILAAVALYWQVRTALETPF